MACQGGEKAKCCRGYLVEFVEENLETPAVVLRPEGVVERQWERQDCHIVVGGDKECVAVATCR